MAALPRVDRICYFRTLLARVENVLDAATAAICRHVIAKNEEYIVFCEVKARSGAVLIEPHASITPQKQRNLIHAANHYVLKHRIVLEVSFDIVAIHFKANSIIWSIFRLCLDRSGREERNRLTGFCYCLF